MPDDCFRVFWEGQPGPRRCAGLGSDRAIPCYGAAPYTGSATSSDGRRHLDELAGDPVYDLEEFDRDDLLMMTYDWRQAASRSIDVFFIDSLKRAQNGAAHTVWAEGTPLACFGVSRTAETTGEAWLLYDEDMIDYHVPFLARIGWSYINHVPQAMGLSRVWCQIAALDGKAYRVARFLGFSPEERQNAQLIMSRPFSFH